MIERSSARIRRYGDMFRVAAAQSSFNQIDGGARLAGDRRRGVVPDSHDSGDYKYPSDYRDKL